MTLERLFIFSCLLFLSGYLYSSQPDVPVHSKKWTNKYDHHFHKYSKRYFGPHFNWHWFKAQAIAESGLDSRAESSQGARGLMQVMPPTYYDINKKNPHFKGIDDPKWNVAAGIFYDRQLYRKWQKSPNKERLLLSFASYNAGYARIRRAAKKTDQAVKTWEKTRPHAPGETRAYVRRIRGLMEDR